MLRGAGNWLSRARSEHSGHAGRQAPTRANGDRRGLTGAAQQEPARQPGVDAFERKTVSHCAETLARQPPDQSWFDNFSLDAEKARLSAGLRVPSNDRWWLGTQESSPAR